jgi:hypothetical protein
MDITFDHCNFWFCAVLKHINEREESRRAAALRKSSKIQTSRSDAELDSAASGLHSYSSSVQSAPLCRPVEVGLDGAVIDLTRK